MKRFAVVDGNGRLLAFYSEDIHGPRQVEVTVPPAQEGGEPTTELQPNPACSIPSNAIEISSEIWADWLGRQATVALIDGKLVDVGPKPQIWTWPLIRARRDDLVEACDWTQLPDSPLASGLKSKWAIYRQALRDLPQKYSDPATVIWPVSPS